MLDIHDGYSSLFLASNAAQTSPQRSSNVSPDACLPRIPGPVLRSPAKPPPSPREASVDQFPAITLSPPHLRLKTSPSFLPPAETWYLALARQEPPRSQFAKAKVFREAARSQPLHKSMPCLAISEAPPSVHRPLAFSNKKARLIWCTFFIFSGFHPWNWDGPLFKHLFWDPWNWTLWHPVGQSLFDGRLNQVICAHGGLCKTHWGEGWCLRSGCCRTYSAGTPSKGAEGGRGSSQNGVVTWGWTPSPVDICGLSWFISHQIAVWVSLLFLAQARIVDFSRWLVQSCFQKQRQSQHEWSWFGWFRLPNKESGTMGMKLTVELPNLDGLQRSHPKNGGSLPMPPGEGFQWMLRPHCYGTRWWRVGEVVDASIWPYGCRWANDRCFLGWGEPVGLGRRWGGRFWRWWGFWDARSAILLDKPKFGWLGFLILGRVGDVHREFRLTAWGGENVDIFQDHWEDRHHLWKLKAHMLPQPRAV